MTPPDQLGEDLRAGSGHYLRHRRWVTGLPSRVLKNV